MNHRVSSIRNIRTITALRGEAIRLDLGKEFEGTLQAWMKRTPNSPTHRAFEVENNRYLILSEDKTKDYITSSGVLIDSVEGKWYFDVEQTKDDGNKKTIFTGTIHFENDITGSNSVELVDSSNIGEFTGEINTVEFGISTTQRDPNNSSEASDFLSSNINKKLFWYVNVPSDGEDLGEKKHYWYNYKTSQWEEVFSVDLLQLLLSDVAFSNNYEDLDNLPNLDNFIESIQDGNNITIDYSDPKNPIISSQNTQRDVGNGLTLDGNEVKVGDNDVDENIVWNFNPTGDNKNPRRFAVESGDRYISFSELQFLINDSINSFFRIENESLIIRMNNEIFLTSRVGSTGDFSSLSGFDSGFSGDNLGVRGRLSLVFRPPNFIQGNSQNNFALLRVGDNGEVEFRQVVLPSDLVNKADLVGGVVPASQLPSFVDEIIEGYYDGLNFYEEATFTTLITGESGKIYINLSNNEMYRYGGSMYVQVNSTSPAVWGSITGNILAQSDLQSLLNDFVSKTLNESIDGNKNFIGQTTFENNVKISPTNPTDRRDYELEREIGGIDYNSKIGIFDNLRRLYFQHINKDTNDFGAFSLLDDGRIIVEGNFTTLIESSQEGLLRSPLVTNQLIDDGDGKDYITRDYFQANSTSSSNKYNQSFTTLDWINGEIQVSASTHNVGSKPIVQVFDANGNQLQMIDVNRNPSGDITINVIDGEEFDGEITII